ncbi:efflux RND transporter periplasmic adaptor subunit [Paracoccus sp. 11-3]|uniref:Efflux RND transporter periplasmic adaptor subunit n=1 Tax=Paracoccus amoyensis TaxID=2760093 RepID=A0A926GCG7_9RHOB|nr:efflux RND transporter periplasmic adaptor subunit [Paracoccus amoyensis]MBC9247446.1 efflux RND transporter periplasmic adaptor subunit [Paracoccus amoyensis]
MFGIDRVVLRATISATLLGGLFATNLQAQDAPPPAVVTHQIEVQPIDAPESFTASVEAIESVEIMARIQGFIDEVVFSPGQIVQTGDRLFQIEPKQYQAEVASAQANLAQAEAQRVRAESEANRQQELVNRNAAAQVNLEQARADFQVAEANVQAAQAGVELAQINLGYTTITSPITGKIGQALITKGNFVGPSAGSLAQVVQLDPVRVVFSISEQLLLDMQQSGMAETGAENVNFKLMLSNDTEYAQTGTMEYIDNRVDPATGSIAVRIVYANPDALLLPGQFVTMVIAEKDPQSLPVVPQTAVLQDREGRYVFVVNDDQTVSQKRISTGPRVMNGWAVTEGLAGGEAVVVEGVQRLQDGMAVRVGAQAAEEDTAAIQQDAEGQSTDDAAASDGDAP